MKKLTTAIALAAMMLVASCTGDKPTTTTIVTDVPERPAGQTDMLGFAAEPIDTVRVGFIGLGMRGPGAVERFAHIPGTKIVALCDIDTGNIVRLQRYLTANGCPEAAVYAGNDSVWKQLVERDDLDLIYIATDWKHHVPMAL